ncbi:MAG: glycosyltransferase family 2 protein [Bacteroidaceae bacterium]|nr:glycosyltransferase family 2 protein [Bacteroidaceae bacterium]
MTDLTLAICVYNAEKYIKETLKSVMAQTMQDFHLLIVNDCSTDDSVTIIERFFAEQPRQVEIVTLEKNGGIANARSFAISHATTKYFLFIDSDDLLEPTLVEKEYTAIIGDSELIGVSCWNDFIDKKGRKIHGGTFLGEKTKEAFIEKASKRKLIFLPIHTMFNREYAIKVGSINITGFPNSRPRYQDFCEELDMWTRMSDFYTEEKAIIALPEVLYHYRKMDGLSSNHFNMILKMRYTKQNLLRRRCGEKELTFIEFYDSLTPKEIKKLKRDALAADALRNGVFYLKRKNVFKAAGEIMKSIYYRPGYIFDKLKHNLK